jgi:SCP1.201-like deaminase
VTDDQGWGLVVARVERHAPAVEVVAHGAAAVADRLDERLGALEYVTAGSAASETFRHDVATVAGLVRELAETLGEAAAQMRRYVEGEARGTPVAAASRGARAADPRTPSSPRPVGDRWGRVADVPSFVRAAGETFAARPAGAVRPTTGVFDEERIESGGRDRSVAGDLVHDPLRGPPVTFYQHVESKVAARLRASRPARADVVIDNTVCGSNEHDRDQAWSCEWILPAILPRGTVLTVWATRDGGRTWWRGDYVGTGERIVR